MVQQNNKQRLFRTLVPRRYRRICIDPENVRYIQYPEFRDSQRILARPKTRKLGGDWDQTIDQQVFWCSVYEPAEHVCGIVPLSNYVFYQSLESHFNDGVPWQTTRWYHWMAEQQRNNPVRRYTTREEMAERLEFLDKLHADFKSGIYQDDPIDRPIINIGRHGRMAVEDGRHRLCVARVAGLKELFVDVNVVHADVPMDSI